jgi:hypothetical protein
MENQDFIRTEIYSLRLKPSGVKKVTEEFNKRMNMVFSKGTLHYMKKNAKADKPFTLNGHVRERSNKWEWRGIYCIDTCGMKQYLRGRSPHPPPVLVTIRL